MRSRCPAIFSPAQPLSYAGSPAVAAMPVQPRPPAIAQATAALDNPARRHLHQNGILEIQAGIKEDWRASTSLIGLPKTTAGDYIYTASNGASKWAVLTQNRRHHDPGLLAAPASTAPASRTAPPRASILKRPRARHALLLSYKTSCDDSDALQCLCGRQTYGCMSGKAQQDTVTTWTWDEDGI
ncbi:MAG: hypothetical protein ACOX6W_06915 [Lentisphaeria bacterium]